MKIKFIYALTLLAFGFLSISSFSSGATTSAGDRTGSPLSTSNCTGCHGNPGSFQPTLAIQVIDNSTQMPVTSYVAGQVYTLKFTVAAAGAQYGLQAVMLASNNAQVGTFSAPTTGAAGSGTGAKVTTFNSRSYLEHNKRSTDGVFNVTWVAPALAGSGTATIYSSALAIDAANGNSGDNMVQNTFVLTETIPSSMTSIDNQLEYKLYPNPVINQQIFVDGVDGDATITITDVIGRTLLTQNAVLQNGTAHAVSLPNLSAGIYNVAITQENTIGTKQIIVQ